MNLTDPTDNEAYCYLKLHLEPRFQIVAEPSVEYFSQWMYCYRVFDGHELVHELAGDLRNQASGSLSNQAKQLVSELHKKPDASP